MMTFDGYRLCLADYEAMHAKWTNIWRLGVVVFTRPEEQLRLIKGFDNLESYE